MITVYFYLLEDMESSNGRYNVRNHDFHDFHNFHILTIYDQTLFKLFLSLTSRM